MVEKFLLRSLVWGHNHVSHSLTASFLPSLYLLSCTVPIEQVVSF
jgi:hypothetical protein